MMDIRLYQINRERDEERRAEMERSMLSLGIRDAGERIWQTVLEIIK